MPLNSTIPDPRTKVPLLVKSRATFRLAGAVSEPLPLIVSPPKLVEFEPVIVAFPVKVMVPPPLVNVPLFVQLPATFRLPEGAVSELLPLITTLLNELVLVPEMAVVPPKVTVDEPELSVPLLTRLPLICKAEVGVNVPDTVMLPKVTG